MPRLRRRFLILLAAWAALSCTGCVGLVANLIHAGWGDMVPVRFDQLAGRHVAVVCMTSSASYGNSTAAIEIADRIEGKLRDRIPEIKIIDQQAIELWIDEHQWNEIDYRELGEGIQTDFLIVVDLGEFSLHEGATLYKGRATVGLTVYDITAGEVVYQIDSTELSYPINGGQHSADTTEDAFRSRFLEIIASQVARHFYSYDVKEDYGRDPTFIGN